MKEGILTLSCKDQTGLVYLVTHILTQHGANIVDIEQHATEQVGGHFFIRIHFFGDMDPINALKKELPSDSKLNIHYPGEKTLKMGILVSQHGHCLNELLFRYSSRDLNVEIPFVISNHEKFRSLVEQHNIPFYYIHVSKDDKKENEILDIIQGKTDFLVLARYMQILSKNFIDQYNKDIINIHHSFLPSFKGQDPYQQAFDRGVKVIGASAHFVTENLDEGPIIVQEINPVTHNDSVKELKKMGKFLENRAFIKAIEKYIDQRVLPHHLKTIVF